MTSDRLFAEAAKDARAVVDPLFAPEKKFGEAGGNGKYHMPLLPGERGVKSGGNWVPYGLTRATNVAGALSDQRALNVWEQALGLVGMALSPELYEELVLIVEHAVAEGVNFEKLREYPELQRMLAGQAWQRDDTSIIARAKHRSGGNAAAQRGTNQHTAWEVRAATGALVGTAAMRERTLETERLLAEADLERVPGLSERVVRNTELSCAGKFDDILRHRRTGKLYMADLKSKARGFFSWLEVDIQLAIYAFSPWMLTPDRQGYEPGPLNLGVDLKQGVVLHVPSDGGPAKLCPVDLVAGWRQAELATRVMAERSAGKGVKRHRMDLKF